MARTTTGTLRIAAACIAASALLHSASVLAQTEISRGTVIASTCFTCHGTHGTSPSSIPSIDYMQPERMIEILKSYRSGQRVSTVMGRHASGYTDAEIVEVANALSAIQKKGK
jgi:cytochrome subunit of sulfide dehydrogenase